MIRHASEAEVVRWEVQRVGGVSPVRVSSQVEYGSKVRAVRAAVQDARSGFRVQIRMVGPEGLVLRTYGEWVVARLADWAR
jgi:hypothetical protein